MAKAMRKGLVDVVEKLLGKPPTHMYDYGMQLPWTKRAYQWVADQRRPPAIYPIHCWSAGYGGPQEPLTWFACSRCGSKELGSPHALPKQGCTLCSMSGEDFTGWVVADENSAFAATLRAAQGMPEHSFKRVIEGP